MSVQCLLITELYFLQTSATDADCAGLRLAAVSDQHGKSRRTLFAVLGPELSASPEKELAQQLLSLLKHLPLIGDAH